MIVEVSGPGIERRVALPALGLSAAINPASAAARRGDVASFYVRVDDSVVYRLDVEGGVVEIIPVPKEEL